MNTEEIRATAQLARALRALWLVDAQDPYSPPYAACRDEVGDGWSVVPFSIRSDRRPAELGYGLTEAQAREVAEALNAPAAAAALREVRP